MTSIQKFQLEGKRVRKALALVAMFFAALAVLVVLVPTRANAQSVVGITVPRGTKIDVTIIGDTIKKSDTTKKVVPVPKKAQEQAGERGMAFLRDELSKDALVNAIAEGDASKLRATPEQFMEAVRYGSGQTFKSRKEFASWLYSLQVVTCGEGIRVRMGRIMEPSGNVKLDYWREYRKGEMCLRDNNSGLLILSLTCGNPVDNAAQIARDRAPADSLKAAKAKIANDSLRRAHERIDGIAAADAFKGRTSGGLTQVFVPDTIVHKILFPEKARVPKPSAVVAPKNNHTLAWVVGTVVTLGAGWLIWDNNRPKNTTTNNYYGCTWVNGKQVCPNGGPVNAPNGLRAGISVPFRP